MVLTLAHGAGAVHSPAAADGAAATGPKPPVVGGIALLYAFGRLGLVGHRGSRIRIAFTTTAWCWRKRSYRCRSSSSPRRCRQNIRPDYDVVAATLGARRRPPCGGV